MSRFEKSELAASILDTLAQGPLSFCAFQVKAPPNCAFLLGLIISVCGLSLLCILCGLGFVSLAMSGIAMISYVVVSCLMSYWFSPR